MKKLLSIFMSVVMVVTMLPKVSFAEGNDKENFTIEEQQTEKTKLGKNGVNTDSEGVFKYLQDKFSSVANYLKEQAPQTWKKLNPYVEPVKSWGNGYCNSVLDFTEKAGKLGVVATIAISTLICKVAWKIVYKICELVTKIFGPGDSRRNCSTSLGYLQPDSQIISYNNPYLQYQS